MPPRASDLQSYIHRDRAAPQSNPHPHPQPQSQIQGQGQGQNKHASPSRNAPRFAHPHPNLNGAKTREKRTDLNRDRDPFGTDVSGLLTDFENENLDLDLTVQPGRAQQWGGPPAPVQAPIGGVPRNARSRFGSEVELDLESSVDGERGHVNGGASVNGGDATHASAGNVLSWMKRTQEQDPEYAAFLEERRRVVNGNGATIGNGNGNGTRKTAAGGGQQQVVSRNLSPKAQREIREPGVANGMGGETQVQAGQGDLAHGHEIVDQASHDEQMDIDTIEPQPNTTSHPSQHAIEPEPTIPKPKDYTPDYTPSQLTKMKFSSLSTQPFHSDPHSKPPQFPSELTSTASRLEHILHTSPGQANAFFASLPMESYAECGDLLVEKVAGLVARIVELRREKRAVSKTCEDEVVRREEVLQSEREKLGGELERLKRAGENVVRGGE